VVRASEAVLSLGLGLGLAGLPAEVTLAIATADHGSQRAR